jgi:hypothetical protein
VPLRHFGGVVKQQAGASRCAYPQRRVLDPWGFRSASCAARWLVADLGSLEAAEAFVGLRHQLDTGPPHTHRMAAYRAEVVPQFE